LPATVKRNLKKAGRMLTIERASRMEDVHQDLMLQFVQRIKPVQRIKELFFKMPQYVAASQSSIVLNAWDTNKKLVAFYVTDLAAKDFANYIIGCYSKKNYVLGASDLLMSELIKMSSEYDKDYIHLGLGVNSGIRRFKEKWGAVPTLSYSMCELILKKPFILEVLRDIRKFGTS
jgi:hypothetical protein